MIMYLTVAEQPSGIYSSQVIDNCNFISKISSSNVKLVALISIKGFRKNKKRIKSQYRNSIVLPMFPKLKNWRLNQGLLLFVCLFFRSKIIICRNAIPTVLALKLKRINLAKTVIYDGRAAEYEQFVEYGVVEDKQMHLVMKECENIAINFSDYQLAVSNALVRYWIDFYNYTKTTFTVIPCTLNRSNLTVRETGIKREELGFSSEDVVLVFSGSSSKWQSFSLLFEFLSEQLNSNTNVKVLLMTKPGEEVNAFIEEYKGRVLLKWCKEEEVNSFLALADYGLLFRERSITNQVASPVKFAEYLNAGLNVIISAGVGDLAEFVKAHNCGIVFDGQPLLLQKIPASQKDRNKQLSFNYFSKESTMIKQKFKDLLNSTGYVN